MKVFVHGSGRTGRDAWPSVGATGSVFLDLGAAESLPAKVRAIASATADGDTVVAHSSGAVAVVLALQAGRIAPARLVLVEPALYDVARGAAPIESHIGAMTAARGRAAAGDLFGFWAIVRPLMFGGPVDEDLWDGEQELAERFASVDPPWGHGLEATDLATTPTLVVTGAWNEEYEAIAAALARHGARHVHLGGHRHRPQDHPDFQGLLDALTETRCPCTQESSADHTDR